MSRQRKGATLLHVLAVLLIVAAMASLLLPVFYKARECTRCITSCSPNQRQVGLAMEQYAQDNNNCLPPGTQGAGVGWAGPTYTYSKSAGLYTCPYEKMLGPHVSFGYNINIARHPSLDHLTEPSRTVMLFEVAQDPADVTQPDEGASRGAASFSAAGDGTDGGLRSGRSAALYATGGLGGRPPAPYTQVGEPRHSGGSEFLLADGHVKYFKPGEVSSGGNAAHVGDAQTGSTAGSAAGVEDDASQKAGYAATFSVK